MHSKPKPQPSEAQMAARIANIAKARKAKARKAKQRKPRMEVVEIPLDLIPAPAVRAVAKPKKPSSRPTVELEALAEFTALVFLAIRRRG